MGINVYTSGRAVNFQIL